VVKITKNRQNTYEIGHPDFVGKEFKSVQDAHDSLLKHLASQSFNKSGFNLKAYKTAYHGGIGGGLPTSFQGGNQEYGWSPSTGNNPRFNPFTSVPEFGGRWRGKDGKGNGRPDISGGDQQIDDDRDEKNKSLRQQRPEDYHDLYLKNIIKDNIENADVDKDGKSYAAFVKFDSHDKAKEFAKKHKDIEVKIHKDNTVEVICPSFEKALAIEKIAPGVIIKSI